MNETAVTIWLSRDVLFRSQYYAREWRLSLSAPVHRCFSWLKVDVVQKIIDVSSSVADVVYIMSSSVR